MEHNEEGFGFSYAGTVFTIHRLGADRYLFIASIGLDAGDRRPVRQSVECTGETLEKAVTLAKQGIGEILREPIEFCLPRHEWFGGITDPYLELVYALGGEAFSLHGTDEEELARITVTSPAFPAVMTLLHNLAVLFQNIRDEVARQKASEETQERSLLKVLCPFCGRPIRPKSNFCSACGEPLLDVVSFAPSEEEIDPNETLWFCKHCGSFASWTDTYCRICGERLK